MDVKRTLLSGFLYTGLAKYSGIVVSIIISAVLSRLLSPGDFGIIAIASVFINFFSTLTTVGIGPSIVQNKTIDSSDLRSINTFTFFLATGLTFVFVLCTPVICAIYENTETLLYSLLILSISIFFSVACIVPNAIIMKEKNFKFIAIRTFVVQVSIGIISIIAALSGLGIYSLLINPVLGSIVLFIVNFKKVPIGFSLKIQRSAISKILSFSVYQMLFNFVYLLYRNVDKLFIGKYFGTAQLGYYEKSYRLMLLPLDNITGVIAPVLHPVLSEYQDDKDFLWNNYLRIIKLLGEIGFFISVVAYFCADQAIMIMFGDQWTDSIPIFKILSLSIGFQIMQSPIAAFLQAINQVKSLFYASIFVLLSVVVSLTIGLMFGNMLIFCYLLSFSFCITFFIYQYYFSKHYNKSIVPIVKSIVKPVFTNALLFAVAFIVFNYYEISYTITSTLVFCLGAVIYELFVLKFGFAKELKQLIC